MNSIGIIGYGVVGKAVDKTMSTRYQVLKYDIAVKLNDFEDLLTCDLIFICVPSPFDCRENRVDDSSITDSLEKLSHFNYKGLVLIKSTIPPGHSDKYIKKYDLKILFNPEFLRESITPDKDFREQDTVVIGTPDREIYKRVKSMYQACLLPEAQYYHVSLKESEMIKCAQNTMLASRVSLANMIFDACESHNLDYTKIKDIAFSRFSVLGPHMVEVPGPDGKRGFGGKCLPKDIRAFSTIYNSSLLSEIINYNDTLRSDLAKFLVNYNDKWTELYWFKNIF